MNLGARMSLRSRRRYDSLDNEVVGRVISHSLKFVPGSNEDSHLHNLGMVQDVYTVRVHQVFCDMGRLGIQPQVQKVG